ncbi:hypothetical protein AB0M54_06840 [Actinoplanes sp. NPDC051470]|uniref:hypothetical protein n=1 Tax=Actinoplanes sp. NPDC051470 TaxID=3157224 RepID=UPI00343E26EA
MAGAVSRARWQVLLSALGVCQLLRAANASPLVRVLGVAGGLVLVAIAWAARRRAALVAGIIVGTVPFAAVAWTALVPVVLVPVAFAVACPVSATTSVPSR